MKCINRKPSSFSLTVVTFVLYERNCCGSPIFLYTVQGHHFLPRNKRNPAQDDKEMANKRKKKTNNYTTIFDLNHFIPSMTYFLTFGVFQEIISVRYLRNFQTEMLASLVLTYLQHKIAVIPISTDLISF
jgi:hypothetical protein